MRSAAQFPLFPSRLIRRRSIWKVNETHGLHTILEIIGGILDMIGCILDITGGVLEITGGIFDINGNNSDITGSFQHMRRHGTELPLLQFIQSL